MFRKTLIVLATTAVLAEGHLLRPHDCAPVSAGSEFAKTSQPISSYLRCSHRRQGRGKLSGVQGSQRHYHAGREVGPLTANSHLTGRMGRMTRNHQPDQADFRVILPEDIDWKPFPAFPPGARLAVLVATVTITSTLSRTNSAALSA